jgi:hypothetical protein
MPHAALMGYRRSRRITDAATDIAAARVIGTRSAH